ncbi:MAG: hypothetical protein ACI8RA_002321, partial [Chlamydiales bacterium]
KHHFGWDLDNEIEKAKNKVQSKNNITIRDYHVILNEFFSSTRDYHVSVHFYNTERSSLPFSVKSAKGRYYLTYIDRKALPQKFFPSEVGDELVLFDGKPTDTVVKQIKKEALFNDGRITGDGNDRTDHSEAERLLTNRYHGDHIVPKGPVNIAIKKKYADILTHYTLSWQYTPEKVPENSFANFNKSLISPKTIAATENILPCGIKEPPRVSMTAPFWSMEKSLTHKDEINLHLCGSKKSFIPRLGPVLWETSAKNSFDAYLFHAPDGKQIGYVRIPHYMGGHEEESDFSNIIQHLEDNSDALIIDQINNPGGSVSYLYNLASMLTDKPLELPKHRMTITQNEVLFAAQLIPHLERISTDMQATWDFGPRFGGHHVNKKLTDSLLDHSRLVIDEWNNGKAITKPCYINGIQTVQPSDEARYTKPILLLTNEMDFSGGDFFPAILQDNKRVTILGTNTAGAGGTVDGFSYPNMLGVEEFKYTSSLAERSNNNPIENLGVQPDIEYELGAYDFQNNYSEYVNIILSTLKGMK